MGSTFELSFDDLTANQKAYYYKIEHMNYQWEPSSISSREYINGFQQNQIFNIDNSFNTLQNYTHYKVSFPNEQTTILMSGNYQISILDETDIVLFKRRFVLFENNVHVGIEVKRSRDSRTTNQQQTVHFTINNPNFPINNPSEELKVIILQNENWATKLSNIQPQFFKKNQFIYKYQNKTNFWAGNEYLNFDNTTIRNSSSTIAKVKKHSVYHNYLHTQYERANLPYTYAPDINGNFLIRTVEAPNPETEADYAWVHFSLDLKEKISAPIFVYGAFNNYTFSPENRLKYNLETKKYEASILLKQGFYNYQFATMSSDNTFDTVKINGSFYQTENQYTIIVYYQPFGSEIFRALGVGKGNSQPQ